ncbi:Alpha/Beta hydrolase protein [Lophiotrema nucula]|uniref:Alpha/Beta hydrolase protein n=1 Tax=Lophiotrema nucula TaxID=690887 RepID=A0A6A5Z362_9PLEO|nr:Alpha/Beta hydrolase protein [Lophiotrema nucula]
MAASTSTSTSLAVVREGRSEGGAEGEEKVEKYSMHVSQRYLSLTAQKLSLTRLPREVGLPEERRWEMGTPKAVLEGVLDYWEQKYDWRTQEAHFNTSLPQFRTTIQIPSTPDTPSHSLRIHFTHKRSKHPNAIPLLFCHTWPASFVEVQKIIDALTDPQSLPSFGAGAQQAFHVVAPSIPGFGFSDASSDEGFGVKETAAMFDGVMRRLGYEGYVAHGVGWGFSICRALAVQHPQRCMAVHTANPSFGEPTWKRSKVAYMKYRVARWTRARISLLSFGYTPAEVQSRPAGVMEGSMNESLYAQRQLGTTLSGLYSLRPQTLSFSLCDSPVGLLAALLDIIHTRAPSSSPVTSRSRSPFLSPVELEMRDSHHARTSPDPDIRSMYTWSPTEVLNWVMIQWLPGPEASLRWLRRAHLDTGPDAALSTTYCPVPLGISSFRARNASGAASPLMFGSASWRIEWVKRHQRPAILPAWEAPDLLVLDMRECFGTFLSQGLIRLAS